MKYILVGLCEVCVNRKPRTISEEQFFLWVLSFLGYFLEMQSKTIVLYVFYHSFIPSLIFLKESYSLKKKVFIYIFLKEER